MLATAFPDQHYELQEMVAEGDSLVVRWRMTGTHLGELAGPTMTIPPTGKRLDIWGMSMYRIEDGMAREIWRTRHVGAEDGVTDSEAPVPDVAALDRRSSSGTVAARRQRVPG